MGFLQFYRKGTSQGHCCSPSVLSASRKVYVYGECPFHVRFVLLGIGTRWRRWQRWWLSSPSSFPWHCEQHTAGICPKIGHVPNNLVGVKRDVRSSGAHTQTLPVLISGRWETTNIRVSSSRERLVASITVIAGWFHRTNSFNERAKMFKLEC